MKVFLVSLLVLTGCTFKRDYIVVTEQVGNYGVQKVVDKSTGTVCYVYRDADNSTMSCVTK